MEFYEIKQIWDVQDSQPLYVIDEKALRNRIQRKKHTVLTNISEWLLIISYLGVVCVLVGRHPFTPGSNKFLYLEAVWMFAIVVYLVVYQIRRIKAGRRFDRSIHGDLDHAISLISSQMHVSQVTRWNLLPMGVIMIFSGWESGKLFLVSTVIVVVYTLVFYATGKGLRLNGRRKRGLQVVKEKLETGILKA